MNFSIQSTAQLGWGWLSHCFNLYCSFLKQPSYSKELGALRNWEKTKFEFLFMIYAFERRYKQSFLISDFIFKCRCFALFLKRRTRRIHELFQGVWLTTRETGKISNLMEEPGIGMHFHLGSTDSSWVWDQGTSPCAELSRELIIKLWKLSIIVKSSKCRYS